MIYKYFKFIILWYFIVLQGLNCFTISDNYHYHDHYYLQLQLTARGSVQCEVFIFASEVEIHTELQLCNSRIVKEMFNVILKNRRGL